MTFNIPEAVVAALMTLAGLTLGYLISALLRSKADSTEIGKLRLHFIGMVEESSKSITASMITMMETRLKMVPTREEMLTAIQAAMAQDHANDLEMIRLVLEPIKQAVDQLNSSRDRLSNEFSDLRKEVRSMLDRLSHTSTSRQPVP